MTGWVSGDVVMTHDVGLHARPSVKLTKLAKTFAAKIEISGKVDGPWIDAKSIVKVMAMKVKQHEKLYVRAEGQDADRAVAAIMELVRNDFPEDGVRASGT
jgi:phosphocarrier protein